MKSQIRCKFSFGEPSSFYKMLETPRNVRFQRPRARRRRQKKLDSEGWAFKATYVEAFQSPESTFTRRSRHERHPYKSHDGAGIGWNLEMQELLKNLAEVV